MSKNSLVISFLFVVLTAFHLVATWGQSAAHVIPDEISYLAQARYFAGKDITPDTKSVIENESYLAGTENIPSTENWPYYHFGYSLLISPIYWLTDTPTSSYKGIMLVNSFMLSSLFLIIYAWLRMISKIDNKTAIIIAFVTALYPAYVLQAHIGWAENAFIPGFALSCLLFTRHLKVSSIYTVTVFAIIAGFQFTIHPRGLAVAIAAIICLAAIALTHKEQRQTSIIGLLTVIGVILATKVTTNEMAIIMNTVTQEERISQKMPSILSLELIPAILGNLFYLILSTLGVFLLGVTESIKQIFFHNAKNIKTLICDKNTGTLLYAGIASGLTFFVGIFFLAQSSEWHNVARNLDYFMYGRYNEGFLSIYIALGLLWICRDYDQGIERFSRKLNVGFWLLVTLGLAFSLLLADFSGLRAIHSFGLFPWSFLSLFGEGWLRIAPIFIAPLLWTFIVMQFFLQNKNKGLIAVGSYFFLLDISLIVYKTPNLQVLGG